MTTAEQPRRPRPLDRLRPHLARRRVAAYGCLAIVVALVVGLFYVAGDLRRNRQLNVEAVRQLNAQRAAEEELRELVGRQAVLLGRIADRVPATEADAAVARQLTALTARILAAPPASSPATSGTRPAVVVNTTPAPATAVPGPPGRAGAAGARGRPGPTGPPGPTSTPAPCAVPVPLTDLCLRRTDAP